jgi:serine/threonine-protein kinase
MSMRSLTTPTGYSRQDVASVRLALVALDRELLTDALPRYEILDEIGRGGWGIVLEGRHRELDRRVAIKQLPRAFGADPAVRDRFIAEARLVASLDHPHIVPAFDFVEHQGLYLIVMEFASGGTLWDRFFERGLETDESVAITLAAAVGLHYAHERGVLHRDVKPENILFSESGTAKIADFGIAKAIGGGQRTATGTIMGTAAYMAPEQVTGSELTPATDVYALGVVLYELLSGQLPFPEVTEPLAQLYQHVHDAPRAFDAIGAEVPEPISAAVMRALAKEPDDRPESSEDFAVELATASTQAFGAGWLTRSGTAVMSATRVVGATEREPEGEVDRRAGTVMVRAAVEHHHRLGAVQSGVEAGSATEAPVLPPAPPGEATPGPAPAPAPASSPPSAGPALSAPTADASAEKGGNRNLILLGAAFLIVLAVSLVVILTGGEDNGRDETADTDPEETAGAVTATEAERFRNECVDNGVSEERCGCAIERALAELTTEQFREGLAQIEQTDALSADLTNIFNSCVDDGF